MSTEQKRKGYLNLWRTLWQRYEHYTVMLGCFVLLLVGATSSQQAQAATPGQETKTETQSAVSIPASPATNGQANPQAVECGPDWAVVESDNYRELSTLLTGVAAVSANDVWAVGYHGTYVGNGTTTRTHIVHWNGQSWSRVPSPNAGNGVNVLQGVTALASNDVWAVGYYVDANTGMERTLVLHWNGTAWAQVTSPNTGAGHNQLKSISHASANNIWAVGHYVNNSSVNRTLIMKWNGSNWSTVSSPNQGANYNRLSSVSVVPGTGGADVWAVGGYIDASSNSQPLIQRYTNGTWGIVTGANLGAGTSGELFGVVSISATDVWATGTYSNNPGEAPLSEHWNGSTWAKVSMPGPASGGVIAVNVSAVASNDVWAVGYKTVSSQQYEQLWHWNGSVWSLSQGTVASPSHLSGVAAIASGDVWAVGFTTSLPRSSIIEHWNGQAWSLVASPNGPTTANYLADISASSPNNIWAVGSYEIGSGHKRQTLIERWDGTSWSRLPSPNQGTGHNSLNGVAAVPGNDNDAWAVGSYYDTAVSQYRTLIMRWNGSAWGVVPSPSPGTGDTLTSVSVVSPNDIWAVGSYLDGSSTFRTLMLHWNGSTWTQIASPSVEGGDVALEDVAVVPHTQGADVWAVGYSVSPSSQYTSLILRWNGGTSSWSIVPSPNVSGVNNWLSGVSAHTHSDVWAVGHTFDGNNIAQTLTLHWDGQAWSHVDSPNQGVAGSQLNDTLALGTSDVWAVGNYNVGPGTTATLIERWNGTSWSIVSSPDLLASYGGLAAITAASANDLWSAGTYVPLQSSQFQTLVERLNPCPVSCNIQFADVPEGSTYYPYVRCLACRNVLGGYPDGFRPNDNVTRGQAAKIISNAAGYADAIPAATQTFVDVPSSSAFWLFVERVYKHSAISGYSCGGPGEPCPGAYFRPGANLTRGQLAKITTSVAGYNEVPSGQSFNDVPTNSPFYAFIERAKLHNVISGYACGGAGESCPGSYFRPGNNVTRGQTAKIVAGTFFPNCQVVP